MKTVLILGGGTGGVVAAHELKKKSEGKVKVIVADKESQHLFAPSLLWLLTGNRKSAEISRDLYRLNKQGIEFVEGTIEKINPAAKSAVVNGKTITADYLIISLGAEQVKPPELKASGFNFYCIRGAELFRDELMKFSGGKILVLVSSMPYKCPAAPYEAAMLIENYLRKKGLREKSEVSVYSPEPFPLPVTGKANGQAVIKILEQKGINYFPEHQWNKATNHEIEFANGVKTSFDLMAYVPVHRCPAVIAETDLLGESKWVKLKDTGTMETKYPDVYAIGDVTGIPLPSGKMLPKAGVFAHYQAEVVSHNILKKINGGNNFRKFDGTGQCFLETGGGKAGYATGNFYAHPNPVVNMEQPGRWHHWKKVWFEKYWFYKYF